MANIHYQSRVLKPYIAFPIQYRHQSIILLVYHMFAPDMLWICLILFFSVLMTPYLILLAKVRGLKTHNSVKLFTKTNHEGLNIYMYRIQGVNTTPVINIYFIVYYILLPYTSGQTNFLTTICFNASCHIFGGFVCIHIYCSPLFLLK